MKTIGIVAHSAEGASLCFLTACHEGEAKLGPHMHPPIVLSAVPMGLTLDAWAKDDYDEVATYLMRGIKEVGDAGADFYICPDNTAHVALERVADEAPIPGLHIAEVVCDEIATRGYTKVGLLGTIWTMTGPVYATALEKRGLEKLVPDEPTRQVINDSIFEELCQGTFTEATTRAHLDAIADLQARGAECVILGCTEIPLIVNDANSPLPTIDSTRLLAKAAVEVALEEAPLTTTTGWLTGGQEKEKAGACSAS